MEHTCRICPLVRRSDNLVMHLFNNWSHDQCITSCSRVQLLNLLWPIAVLSVESRIDQKPHCLMGQDVVSRFSYENVMFAVHGNISEICLYPSLLQEVMNGLSVYTSVMPLRSEVFGSLLVCL